MKILLSDQEFDEEFGLINYDKLKSIGNCVVCNTKAYGHVSGVIVCLKCYMTGRLKSFIDNLKCPVCCKSIEEGNINNFNLVHCLNCNWEGNIRQCG